MISKYSINLFPFRIKLQFCPGAWSAGAETGSREPLECREHPSQLVRSPQDYLMSRASPILSHSGIPAELSITHKRVRSLVWDPSPLRLFSLAGVWMKTFIVSPKTKTCNAGIQGPTTGISEVIYLILVKKKKNSDSFLQRKALGCQGSGLPSWICWSFSGLPYTLKVQIGRCFSCFLMFRGEKVHTSRTRTISPCLNLQPIQISGKVDRGSQGTKWLLRKAQLLGRWGSKAS